MPRLIVHGFTISLAYLPRYRQASTDRGTLPYLYGRGTTCSNTMHMKKILMALVAIFITVSASAQSGCCAHKAKGSCAPKAEAAASVVPEAAATAEDATEPAIAATAADAPTASTTTEAVAGVSAPGVPCPSRPGCICPNGVKADGTTTSSDDKAPCPNRPGCVCH